MANISHFLVCTLDKIINLRYTNILNCSFITNFQQPVFSKMGG